MAQLVCFPEPNRRKRYYGHVKRISDRPAFQNDKANRTDDDEHQNEPHQSSKTFYDLLGHGLI